MAGLIDRYSHTWLSRYWDADSFIQHVNITPDMLEPARTGSRPGSGERQEYSETVALQLKQVLVRDLWGNEAYWKLFNETNPVFLKALEALQDMAQPETPAEP